MIGKFDRIFKYFDSNVDLDKIVCCFSMLTTGCSTNYFYHSFCFSVSSLHHRPWVSSQGPVLSRGQPPNKPSWPSEGLLPCTGGWEGCWLCASGNGGTLGSETQGHKGQRTVQGRGCFLPLIIHPAKQRSKWDMKESPYGCLFGWFGLCQKVSDRKENMKLYVCFTVIKIQVTKT